MTDTYFKSLHGCDTVKTGLWIVVDDPITKRIVLTHQQNVFAIHLPYDSRGEFVTCTPDLEHYVATDAQDPTRLPGSSGISPENEAASLVAWTSLEVQNRDELVWIRGAGRTGHPSP